MRSKPSFRGEFPRLSSLKRFSSFMFCLFLFAFFSFQKDEAFTHLSCLAHAWCFLAKNSQGFPHSTSFSALLRPPPCKKMTCTLRFRDSGVRCTFLRCLLAGEGWS